MVQMMLESCKQREYDYIYSKYLPNTNTQSNREIKAYHKGIEKPKTSKYSCKVFYPDLKSNRECG